MKPSQQLVKAVESRLSMKSTRQEIERVLALERKGRLIESLLVHPHIKAIRRIGLLFAVDFDSAERVNRIVQHAKEMGVITYWFLSHPYSFRIAPPLTITDDEIHEACRIILKAIEKS